MADITWNRLEIPPDGVHQPAFSRSAAPNSTGQPAAVAFAGRTFRGAVLGIQNDTNTQLVRKPRNSKSYERTRQLIENKGHEVSKPVNLLKAGSLAPLSRQGIENMNVIPENLSVKNSNPVNLLKLNMVSPLHPVNSLKIRTLT